MSVPVIAIFKEGSSLDVGCATIDGQGKVQFTIHLIENYYSYNLYRVSHANNSVLAFQLREELINNFETDTLLEFLSR